MNNSEFDKVNWVNIVILKDFQNYFNLKELQSLSKLSKLIRSKLMPNLFKCIQLITEKGPLNESFVKFFNSDSYVCLYEIVSMGEYGIQNNLNIQNSLINTNPEIQDIKHFSNSFIIYNIKQLGHYLSHIIINFSNLTVLKIHRSTIQYFIFHKLGKCFPALKTFKLFNVVLLKDSIYSDNPSEIVFPPSLKNLIINRIEVVDKSISPENYKAVLNSSMHYARSEYVLPNIYLPCLKNLQFLRCSTRGNGLKYFLEKNPNLEELSIDTFCPSLSKSFKFLKSLSVEEIYESESLENIIAHHSIKTLKINSEYGFYSNSFEKLCLMCPSVEFLEFSISNSGTYQEISDNYLVPSLKKLRNLKTLELQLETVEDFESIDINRLPYIEKIIFKIANSSYFRINFEKSHNLKEIEIRTTASNINKEDFLNHYKSYTEWEFKFYKRKVNGYKVW